MPDVKQLLAWFDMMADKPMFQTVKIDDYAIKKLDVDTLSVYWHNSKGVLQGEWFSHDKLHQFITGEAQMDLFAMS